MFMPCVTKAEYRGGYRIRVAFNDGSEKTIDFGEWSEGPMFEPLKNPDYFRRFFLAGAPLHGQSGPTWLRKHCTRPAGWTRRQPEDVPS